MVRTSTPPELSPNAAAPPVPGCGGLPPRSAAARPASPEQHSRRAGRVLVGDGAPNMAMRPSPPIVHRALETVYGVHHLLEGRIEERLARFGIQVTDQLGIPFEVGNSTVTCLRSPSRALLEVRFLGEMGGV